MICVTLITIKEMNMYSKKIGLTLATILPLVLVGCGGGGGSDGVKNNIEASPKETNTVNETFVKFDLSDLSYREYAYVNGVVPNTEHYLPLGDQDFLLTSDKLYTNTWVDASTKALTPLSLYFSDAPNVSRIDHLEKIDISGKNVYDTVYPGFTEYFDFYKGEETQFQYSLVAELYNQTTMTFPQGATCYRTVSSIPSKGYIRFSKDNFYNFDFDLFINDFEKEFIQNANNSKSTFKIDNGTWAGYKWKYYRKYDAYGMIDDALFVNYDNQTVLADMVDFEKQDVNQLLTEAKQRLSSISDHNSEYYQTTLLSKNLIEKTCSWYNKTAQSTIRTLNNK